MYNGISNNFSQTPLSPTTILPKNQTLLFQNFHPQIKRSLHFQLPSCKPFHDTLHPQRQDKSYMNFNSMIHGLICLSNQVIPSPKHPRKKCFPIIISPKFQFNNTKYAKGGISMKIPNLPILPVPGGVTVAVAVAMAVAGAGAGAGAGASMKLKVYCSYLRLQFGPAIRHPFWDWQQVHVSKLFKHSPQARLSISPVHCTIP
jgi:hypothetical protein